MNGLLDFLRGKFVRTDRTGYVTNSTADNIVACSSTTQTAIDIQGAAAQSGSPFRVYSQAGSRLEVTGPGSVLIGGSLQLKHNALTGTTTPGTTIAASARTVISCSTAADTANRHYQLPPANTLVAGQVLIVYDATAEAATKNITLNRAGSDTITTTSTGQTTCVISTAGGAVILISDGTSVWKVLRMTG